MTTSGSPSAGNDALTCPACGAANAPGSRFCERCGTRLTIRPRADEGSSSATATTQTFALPPAGRPAEQGERTLVGIPTPSSADAERAPEPEPHQESAAAPPEPSFRDQPTRSFALPPATPSAGEERQADTPPADSRNAPTVSFVLPKFDEPAAPSTTDTPPDSAPHGTEATLTGIELPSAPAPSSQPESPAPSGPDESAAPSWNYQAWTPPPPGAGPRDDTPAPAATATQPSLPLIPAPPPPASPVQSPASAAAQPPPTAPGRYAPPSDATSGPLPSMYPSPGQPPAASAGAYTAPAVTQPVGPYPAPAKAGRGGNRTLWIIFGGVAVLLIICALMCVGLLLIGALGSTSSSTALATSAATVVP
ncbi:MAG: zinc-ribbon domain-containing protein [Thermomicrobiales bacterium]